MSTQPAGSQGLVLSQDLHPVAFQRARPFVARIVAELAAAMGPRQTYVQPAMRQAAESMTKAYGAIRRQLAPEFQTNEAAIGIVSGTFEVITPKHNLWPPGAKSSLSRVRWSRRSTKPTLATCVLATLCCRSPPSICSSATRCR